MYRGDVNKLVRMLGSFRLQDISLDEPDLEEIFMHYHQKDNPSQ